MPSSKTETALTSLAMDMALTLDQLVAPLEVPADLSRARWAPKWTLILPIAMLAAFTVPVLPMDSDGGASTATTRLA